MDQDKSTNQVEFVLDLNIDTLLIVLSKLFIFINNETENT